MRTSRRQFVAMATGATVAGGFAACGGSTSPSSPTPSPTPSPPPALEVRLPLMGVGETVAASVVLVSGLSTPIAVTRISTSEVVAVSRVCTHQGCTVGLPAVAGATLDCPCHGSRFTVSGQVVNGPAARALASFPAAIRGSEVVITIGV
ncbi:MAG TPA: Rieske (2Fe-2S) protein [Vicinamibacteria bacterium]|nr:Rieske (2Fe-2S) protein [Vicinamibacteria bacterium]